MDTKPLLPVYLFLALIIPSLLFYACVSKPASTELRVEIGNATEQAYTDIVIQIGHELQQEAD